MTLAGGTSSASLCTSWEDGVGGTFLEYHRDCGDGPEYVEDVAEVDDLEEALDVLSQCELEDFI